MHGRCPAAARRRERRGAGSTIYASVKLLGRHDDADTYARQVLDRCREIGDRIITAYALTVLALSARALGDDQRAERLWRAIGAEEQQALLARWAEDRDPYQRRINTPESTGFNGAALRRLGHGRRLTSDEVPPPAPHPLSSST